MGARPESQTGKRALTNIVKNAEKYG